MSAPAESRLGRGSEVVARKGQWSVHRCPRGCVHLHLGAASLRLTPSEWRTLVEMCVEAEVCLEVRDALHALPRQ